MNGTSAFAWLRQNLRYDGLWWRKFAYLGCVYGPEWWKRYSPPAIAAIIFVLGGAQPARCDREHAAHSGRPGAGRVAPACRVAHVRRVRPLLHGDDGVLRTTSAADPHRHVPSDDELAQALRTGQGAVVVTGHFGNWDVAAKELREYGRPINMVMAREVNATHQRVRAAGA